MPSYSTRVVAALLSERAGLQRVELDDGRRAYVLTELIGPVDVGDRVVVNTTAVDLGLGTGGWHPVHWNLARESWSRPGPGSLMKLRYTSLQADLGAAEEERGYAPPADGLAGRPVVACTLHSQVACVTAALLETSPECRVVYVMTDAAALPLALSDLVADLRDAKLVSSTVTCGQAFGGDREAVNLHSALEVAVAGAHADAVVVAPGPGGAGTRSRLGFGGLEVATVADAAARLGGRPVLAVRFSNADPRARHQGVSHHTAAALWAADRPTLVAVPKGEGFATELLQGRHHVVEVDVPAVGPLLGARGLDVRTMGRSVGDDPAFFTWAAAAGVAAGQLVGG